jgi:hypothetical protein
MVVALSYVSSFVGRKSFSLITLMAFGLCCSSHLGVWSFVFRCLFLCNSLLDCITHLGRFLSNEDGTMLFVQKKKKKDLTQ